jgi:hypothetical protein
MKFLSNLLQRVKSDGINDAARTSYEAMRSGHPHIPSWDEASTEKREKFISEHFPNR